MPRGTDTRDKMLRTAAKLLRRQGYAATGWRQIIAVSETPWGSQAHHFPGGKEQLASEAIAITAAAYERGLRKLFTGTHPGDAVATWFTTAANGLERSKWADGCPVATLALETAHTSEVMAHTCSDAFTNWQRALIDSFLEHQDVTNIQATNLAALVLASFEGALILARASRTKAPLIIVGEELQSYLHIKIT
jgi:TetR/AcrR family transcriptional regulator, lmrAB and yxaGH operons repressor